MSLAVAPDTTPTESVTTEDEEHLVCGCRPQFTMCGAYNPNNTSVIYLDAGPNDCPECVKVWHSTGCGVCGCNASYGCEPCISRYHRHLDTSSH